MAIPYDQYENQGFSTGSQQKCLDISLVKLFEYNISMDIFASVG